MGKQVWKPGNMIYPLPAVMVSCGRPGEKPNIITVAWTGTVCTAPPMVYISVRPERYSYAIIEETKEFVINLTTKDLAAATDYCGVRSGRDVDKFKEMKLTPVPGDKVENISSITPIKDLAKLCGWGGEKNEKSRKFLSDLKQLLIDYNYNLIHIKPLSRFSLYYLYIC